MGIDPAEPINADGAAVASVYRLHPRRPSASTCVAGAEQFPAMTVIGHGPADARCQRVSRNAGLLGPRTDDEHSSEAR